MMRTISITWMMITFLTLISAQNSSNKLDQLELIQQFIGTWKGEFADDSFIICENKAFANGIISTSCINMQGEKTDSIVQIYGYDEKADHFIIAELKESSNHIEICSFGFTSEKSGEMVVTNPKDAPFSFKFEFVNQDLIKQSAIEDAHIIQSISLKRIKKQH